MQAHALYVFVARMCVSPVFFLLGVYRIMDTFIDDF